MGDLPVRRLSRLLNWEGLYPESLLRLLTGNCGDSQMVLAFSSRFSNISSSRGVRERIWSLSIMAFWFSLSKRPLRAEVITISCVGNSHRYKAAEISSFASHKSRSFGDPVLIPILKLRFLSSNFGVIYLKSDWIFNAHRTAFVAVVNKTRYSLLSCRMIFASKWRNVLVTLLWNFCRNTLSCPSPGLSSLFPVSSTIKIRSAIP